MLHSRRPLDSSASPREAAGAGAPPPLPAAFPSRLVRSGPALRRALRSIWVLAALSAACRGDLPERGDPGDIRAALPPVPGVSRPFTPDPGGRGQAFALELEAGVALSLEVQAPAALELELTVLDPWGAPLLILDPAGGSPGPKAVRLVTEVPGIHLLELQPRGVPSPGASSSGAPSLQAPSPEAPASVRVVELRTAKAADRAAAAVDRLFAQAEVERRRGQPEAWERAAALDREALRLAAEAERLDAEMERRRAEILDHLGWIYRKYLERGQAAADAYRRAAELFGRVGDGGRQARVLNNLGRVHFELGEMAAAKEAWTRALALAGDRGDAFARAAAFNHLALHARYRGEVQEALTYYDGCLEALGSAGAALERGRVYNNRGRLYRVLGADEEAFADFERARSLAQEAGSAALQAIVLTAMGQILEGEGELERARGVLERALALRQQVGARKGLGVTLRALGSLDEKQGRYPEAREALERALASFREVEARRDEAASLEALGRLAATEGQSGEALDRYREALVGYRRVGDPYGEVRCLTGLAAAQALAGRPRVALASLDEALAKIEEVRATASSPALAASYFAGQQGPFDLYVDLLMELHGREPAAGFDARAFEASERSRGRALLDLLATGSGARGETGSRGAAGGRSAARGRAPAEVSSLLEEKRRWQQRLSLLEEERFRLLEEEGPSPGPLARVEEELAEALRRYRAVEGELRDRLAIGSAARPLSAGEVRQQVLDSRTLLLEYHLGRRRSFLWLLEPGSLSSYELPPGPDIEAQAERTYRMLKASHRREAWGAVPEALRRMGETLLGPVAGRLGRKRLLIVTEGALLYLPFGALQPAEAEGEGDAEPLLARHEVVTAPSASVLAAMRRNREGRLPAAGAVAVIADPVFQRTDPRLTGRPSAEAAVSTRHGGFRRLVHSAREAEAIRNLAEPAEVLEAIGFEASREAVLDPALGGYRILHLATHGVLDARRPELSRLVLSRFDAHGRPRKAFLFAHEIFDLDLPVDLVVLSACDTALGRKMRGEGLVGLTQAFLDAGAGGLVVSLWQVDDRATAELMERFYRHLLAEGEGPSEALRRAQLSIRQEAAWRAPYFWAGFVHQGEWRPLGRNDGAAKPRGGERDLRRVNRTTTSTRQEDR